MNLPSPAHVGMIARGEIEDPRGSFLAALVKATGVNPRCELRLAAVRAGLG